MATTSPQRLDLSTRLRLAVTRTARRLRQEAGGDLSPTLSAALATVDRHGPLTPSDLAARERVQRPTATRLIGRLEEAGLVARTADPSDGRSCLIAITADGRALLKRIRSRKDEFIASRIATLSSEDREALARAADVLERLLDEDRA